MNGNDAELIVSYLRLRRLLGLLGFLLPIVLVAWGSFIAGEFEIKHSISDYYQARTRDVFVGTLFAIAWFLITYRGYNEAAFDRLWLGIRIRIKDDHLGWAAGIFAMGVAFFPSNGQRWEGYAHYTSAALLFLILAAFSFVFRKGKGEPGPARKVRNRIYRCCGIIILTCLPLALISSRFLTDTDLEKLHPVFWFETFMLWAFAVSWATKGDAIWSDSGIRPWSSLTWTWGKAKALAGK